jgi:ABC-type transporter Mla subunit MlaD
MMPTSSQISVPLKDQRKSRPWIAITVVIVLPILGLTLLSRLAQNGPRLTFSTCMQDAMFLREGAPVLLAGIQIGYIAATTQDRSCPAKATIVITDPDAKIPSDSTTSLTLSKVTGETEMVINTNLTSGKISEASEMIKNGGVLRSIH